MEVRVRKQGLEQDGGRQKKAKGSALGKIFVVSRHPQVSPRLIECLPWHLWRLTPWRHSLFFPIVLEEGSYSLG